MSDQQQPPTPPIDPGVAKLLTMTTSQRFHAWVREVGELEAETQLLDFIVEGGSLHAFCNANGFSYTTALRWIGKTKERQDAYDVARKDRADIYADKVVEVAQRDCSAPVLDREGNLIGTVVDKGKVAQARNEMDALKWQAARMNPKRWGDRIEVDQNINPREASNEQLARALTDVGLGAVADLLLRSGAPQNAAESSAHYGDKVH